MKFSLLKASRRIFVFQKAYSLINILGLTVGIAVCLMLFRIVEFNFGYDDFHPNPDRIFRFVAQSVREGNTHPTSGFPAPFLLAFRNDFPNVKAISPLYLLPNAEINPLGARAGTGAETGVESLFAEEGSVFFTDASLFKIFHGRWLAGDPSALSQPDMVVLDRTHAGRYFGRWEDAAGRYIRLDNDIVLQVAGVIEDYPANSDLPLKVLVSYATLKGHAAYMNTGLDNWGARTTNYQVFVSLPANMAAANVDKQLRSFSEKYMNGGGQAKWTIWLQPLREMHFDSRFSTFSDQQSDRRALWTLSAIGFFILLMAMINFVNLSTAQAVTRSREIGVHKVLGCSRSRLIREMLAETALIVACAVVLATGAGQLLFPVLKRLLDVPEAAPLLTGSGLFLLAGCEVLVTILSGFYPAFVLSGFNPLLALRNKINTKTLGGISIRWGLVILQFASLQLLLIGTIVVLMQMDFVRHADLGYNKDAVLEVGLPNAGNIRDWNPRIHSLKAELARMPSIRATTFCSAAPSTRGSSQTGIIFDNAAQFADFTVVYKSADPDYFSTFQLPFAAGGTYYDGNADTGLVINEMLRRKLQLPDAQSAIGRTLRIGMLGGEDAPRIPIVGVVKDFKDRSLYDSIDPIAIFHANRMYQQLEIKLGTADLGKTIPRLQLLWQTIFPGHVFTYRFLDDKIAQFYRQETQMASLYKLFTGIAILISCLGLFSLVSFMAIRRIKEMSIRKVLGASAGNILYLFSREFTILILIAFAIAGPSSWFFMKHWLDNFVYRIPLNGDVFLLAIGGSLGIAWITIAYHAVRVARVNPAVSLKTE